MMTAWPSLIGPAQAVLDSVASVDSRSAPASGVVRVAACAARSTARLVIKARCCVRPGVLSVLGPFPSWLAGGHELLLALRRCHAWGSGEGDGKKKAASKVHHHQEQRRSKPVTFFTEKLGCPRLPSVMDIGHERLLHPTSCILLPPVRPQCLCASVISTDTPVELGGARWTSGSAIVRIEAGCHCYQIPLKQQVPGARCAA